ncbi:MAG TPA: cupin [Candidatus Limnocylindria bacterium]
MAGVDVRRFDEPDDTWVFGDRGRSEIVTVNDVMVVRSILEPGWSWLADIKPEVEGLESCPLHHREYVVSGRIRYEMAETGEAVEAAAGAYLDIQPGHLASVVGNEAAVLVDFDERWPESD